MRRDRLQNHVSGSVLTLPTCAVLCLVSWYFNYRDVLLEPWTWVSLLVLVLTAYILIELNNRNQLIRVRSRMVSSVWLVLVACIPLLQLYGDGLLVACSMTGAYFMLFRTYQKTECEADTFHYALLLGLSSLFIPSLIFCLPLFLWHQMVFLRSMTLRAFCAAMIGCLFPYLVIGGWLLLKDDLSFILSWWTDLQQWLPITVESYKKLDVVQVAEWGVLTMLSLTGVLHYLGTSYNDKIQVRMFLYILCLQFVVLDTYVCLQPYCLDDFMPLLAVTGAPLIAHYFALTRSWFSNTIFVLFVLACVSLVVVNQYMRLNLIIADII